MVHRTNYDGAVQSSSTNTTLCRAKTKENFMLIGNFSEELSYQNFFLFWLTAAAVIDGTLVIVPDDFSTFLHTFEDVREAGGALS